MNKAILIDFGAFMHSAVFQAVKQQMYAPYLCMRSIFACLKCIEIGPDDLIIIAVDSEKGSWRAKVDEQYKANRAAIKAKSGIDWAKQYSDFDTLLAKLEMSTPFHIIKIDKLEADDIIGYSVRYYHDRECVIISTDSDYQQLEKFTNVKVFSSKSKKYKIIKDPALIVEKKIAREQTDNLVSPILNQADYDRRRMLVDLCKLPDEVEELILAKLIKVGSKAYCKNDYPFQKHVSELDKIYANNTKKIITYSDSFKTKTKRVVQEYQQLDI